MSEIKTFLEDVTFDFEETEESLGAHIALTFDFQGGAASGYNKPLLFKSDNLEINKELISKLKDLGENTESLEKALYANDMRNMLSQAIKDKDFVDKYDYAWVCDWSESVAIFNTDSGTYSVEYTLNGTDLTVSDVANKVVPIQDYVVIGDEILVSDDLMDNLEDQVYQMLSKSLSNPATKEIIKAATKKVGSTTLTANDYAYTPDKEKPSTWKLRLDDSRHTAAAVAALGKGFRGQKVDIPEDDMSAVKSKVRKAYKKFFPDNDVPDIIKSMENTDSVIKSEDKNKPEGNSSVNITKKGDPIVDLNELLKSAEAQDLIKSLVAEATKDKEAEKEELAKSNKALADRLEAVEKAEKARIVESYTTVVKAFSFVAEDNVEPLVKALIDNSAVSEVVLDVLTKAKEEIEKVKEEFGKELGAGTVNKQELDLNAKIAKMAEDIKKAK